MKTAFDACKSVVKAWSAKGFICGSPEANAAFEDFVRAAVLDPSLRDPKTVDLAVEVLDCFYDGGDIDGDLDATIALDSLGEVVASMLGRYRLPVPIVTEFAELVANRNDGDDLVERRDRRKSESLAGRLQRTGQITETERETLVAEFHSWSDKDQFRGCRMKHYLLTALALLGGLESCDDGVFEVRRSNRKTVVVNGVRYLAW